MLTIFAVLFALCIVAGLYGILAWAATRDNDIIDADERRKAMRIVERERKSSRLRNGSRREA